MLTDRQSAREFQLEQTKIFFGEVRSFGDRVASAQEGLTEAVQQIAMAQHEQGCELRKDLKVLQLSTNVNTQLLEQLAARLKEN
jgi:hypothetical protein